MLARFRQVKLLLPTYARKRFVQAFIFLLTLNIAVVCGAVQIWKRFLNLKKRAARYMIFPLVLQQYRHVCYLN